MKRTNHEAQSKLQRKLVCIATATQALARGDIPRRFPVLRDDLSLTGPETTWIGHPLRPARAPWCFLITVMGISWPRGATFRQSLCLMAHLAPFRGPLPFIDALDEELGRLRELDGSMRTCVRMLAWHHHLPSLGLAMSHHRLWSPVCMSGIACQKRRP